MPLTPFDDESFVGGMEAILRIVENNKDGLLRRMENTDKEKNPILYYSYDCALCYLVYKTVKKENDPEMNYVIDNLIKRVVKNLDIMKVEGNKDDK